jgi:putative tricarboxylic transport membrane protein
MAQVAKAAGADPKKLKAVVFQGGGEAITALLGGHVDLIASAANNVVPHIGAGKLRVIGITSQQRLPDSFASVPTWKEQGLNVVINNWRMVAGAKGLSAAQVAYWEGVLGQLAQSEQWKKDLDQNEFEPMFQTSQQAQRFLKSQYEELKSGLGDVGMAKLPLISSN